MNTFLYYFDKWTAWLDFSWLLTLPKNRSARDWCQDEPPPLYEPLLRC
jgi:hypothetical protein